MLKASTPVAVLLVSFVLGVEEPSLRLFVYIVLISVGITVACAAQIDAVPLGILVQCLAIVAEAFRLNTINILLVSRGLKLGPVATLYYIAPLCACAVAIPWAFLEAPVLMRHPWLPLRRVGAPLLLVNATMAFLLNLSVMELIKHTSALTLNVSGVAKDLLLIVWSVTVNGAVVAPVQCVGYAVAVVGVAGYSDYKQRQQRNVHEAQPLPMELDDGG